MPINECIPFFEPGSRPTGRCTATVRGKRFVVVSANPTNGMAGTENIRIAEAGAGVLAIGVSGYDGASGEEIPVLSGSAMIVPVTAGAAITAGQKVMSDSQGRAVPWTSAESEANNVLAIAVEDQATTGNDVAVKLLV